MEKNEQLKGLEIKFSCPFCNWESEEKSLIGDEIPPLREGVSRSREISRDQLHAVFVEVLKKHLNDSTSCFSLFIKKYIKMEEMISKMLLKE